MNKIKTDSKKIEIIQVQETDANMNLDQQQINNFQELKINNLINNIDQENRQDQIDIHKERKNNDLSFLSSYLDKEYSLEDEHETAIHFISRVIDEIVLCLLALFSIGNGIIYYETTKCVEECSNNIEYKDKIITLSLIFSTIGSFFFIIYLFVYYHHKYNLYISAKYISIRDSFFHSGLVGNFIFEFILALIHPNLLFKNKYFTTGSWNLLKVKYCVNDIFLIFTICRLFYIVILFVLFTPYYSSKADRICKMMGKQLDFAYSFKCALVRQTGKFILIITLTFCLGLGYILKILEGPLSEDETTNKGFASFGNCFWNVFITITTVGYGDYSAKTILGRIVTVIISLGGNVIVAMNISLLQSITELDQVEIKTLDLIERIDERKNMQSSAATYFKSKFSYFVNKKKFERDEIPDNKENRKHLLDLATKKYKASKEFKEILQ